MFKCGGGLGCIRFKIKSNNNKTRKIRDTSRTQIGLCLERKWNVSWDCTKMQAESSSLLHT